VKLLIGKRFLVLSYKKNRSSFLQKEARNLGLFPGSGYCARSDPAAAHAVDTNRTLTGAAGHGPSVAVVRHRPVGGNQPRLWQVKY